MLFSTLRRYRLKVDRPIAQCMQANVAYAFMSMSFWLMLGVRKFKVNGQSRCCHTVLVKAGLLAGPSFANPTNQRRLLNRCTKQTSVLSCLREQRSAFEHGHSHFTFALAIRKLMPPCMMRAFGTQSI